MFKSVKFPRSLLESLDYLLDYLLSIGVFLIFRIWHGDDISENTTFQKKQRQKRIMLVCNWLEHKCCLQSCLVSCPVFRTTLTSFFVWVQNWLGRAVCVSCLGHFLTLLLICLLRPFLEFKTKQHWELLMSRWDQWLGPPSAGSWYQAVHG